jgi:AdoMet dependent proline di-methyltransferase
MNIDRLYDYRFRHVDQNARVAVWNEIGRFVFRLLGMPDRILDPAAGRCEFLNAISAAERWGVDLVDHGGAQPGVKLIIGDVMTVSLPESYFGGIWVSNFLEHLADQETVAEFLERMRDRLIPKGRIAVMGPNFRYCANEYFDCADHNVILTHVGVAEHLYAAGFDVVSVTARFLPFSFRSRFPISRSLTRRYLSIPLAWRLLGKQFLVIAERPAG